MDNYAIFLDDERIPSDNTYEQWDNCLFVVRSVEDAVKIVESKGFPDCVYFDHDLGENQKTGYDFARYLVEYDLDTKTMPNHFNYFVHSQNPCGAQNIIHLMDNYILHAKGIFRG